MSLRPRLALAFLLLSVLPLSAFAAAAKARGTPIDQAAIERIAVRLEERARRIESQAERRELTDERVVVRAEREIEASRSALQCSISDGARVVGTLQAKIKGKQLFHSVLSRVDRKRSEIPYSEVEIELAAGDAQLFVSDGLPELPNGDGEPFGYERLRALFGQLAGESACEIVAGLRAAARDWGGDRPPVDDVTLLAVRRA